MQQGFFYDIKTHFESSNDNPKLLSVSSELPDANAHE